MGRLLKREKGTGNVLHRHSVVLLLFDLALLLLADVLILGIYPSGEERLSLQGVVYQSLLGIACVFGLRIAGRLYVQVWRYGGTMLYLRLIFLDTVSVFVYYAIQTVLLAEQITFIRILSLVALNLLWTLSVRLLYQFLYEYGSRNSRLGGFLRKAAALTGLVIKPIYKGDAAYPDSRKINIAIVGAGRVGVMLAEELLNNPYAVYNPCCFIDIDKEKIGRYIDGLSVLSEDEATDSVLAEFPVQEIVFALPEMDPEKKKKLYERYKKTGRKVKVYDYPVAQTVENARRSLREFDIEELLFRNPMEFLDEKTREYYRDKVVLISGGGGSIGSELCRQIARMRPRRLVVVDIYENGAYDIQQELHIVFGKELDVQVEIASICDPHALKRVFDRHCPDIVLHAAAHKHVPLMEHNCCEAVKNNVFGTLNIVKAAEAHGVEKFIMISTDKAVNPTNVMGATKRLCEMIVLNRKQGGTKFSATRFGNVLGSNGSVIPLFKRQIASGGPVTVTDKRIIRYFMTIPEASQLVLQSGAMAHNGELYVLDMGKPIKILDLAESMIRLSGLEPYRDIDIVETGLRPGEKLYEELLSASEERDKTENSMIFIERDKPLPWDTIEEKLALLSIALKSEDDEQVKSALRQAVPTFQDPNEVNASAVAAKEMLLAQQAGEAAQVG